MNNSSFLVSSLICCLSFTNQSTASTPDSKAITSKPTWSVLIGTNASIVLSAPPMQSVLGKENSRLLQANGIYTAYSRVKAGVTIGFAYSSLLSKSPNPNWTADFIILFQQKGFSDWSENPLRKLSTVHLNYLSARQMLKRRLSEKWAISTGIEESFLLDQRQNFKDTTGTIVMNWDVLNQFLNGPGSSLSFTRVDFSILFGAEFKPSSFPATFNVVTGFGLVPIGYGEREFTDELGNVLFSSKDRNAFVNISVRYAIGK